MNRGIQTWDQTINHQHHHHLKRTPLSIQTQNRTQALEKAVEEVTAVEVTTVKEATTTVTATMTQVTIIAATTTKREKTKCKQGTRATRNRIRRRRVVAVAEPQNTTT